MNSDRAFTFISPITYRSWLQSLFFTLLIISQFIVPPASATASPPSGNAAQEIYLKNHCVSIPGGTGGEINGLASKPAPDAMTPLSPGGTATISGTIYKSDGTTQITEDTVWIIAVQGDPCEKNNVASTSTDYYAGTYTLTGLTPGTYYLYTMNWANYLDEWWASPTSVLDCTNAQSITVGENDAIVDKDFQLDAGATISGTVYEKDGRTLFTDKNANVFVFTGNPCGDNQYVTDVWINTSDGTYTVEGLAPGNYYLRIYVSGSFNFLDAWWASPASVLDCADAQAIPVGLSETVADKNFQLDAGAIISGTIYHTDGTTPLTGAGINVEVNSGDACNGTQIASVSYDNTDGTYEISRLSPGTYYLEANVYAGNYFREWWASPASMPACEDAQPISVGLSQNITGKNFQLDAGATISGTVYESNGTTPLTGKNVWITVYQGDPCGVHEYVTAANVWSVDGTYMVSGLLPGDYYLVASTNENYLDEWWASPQSAPDCHGAQTFTAGLNDTLVNKNFQLNAGATVSGTVYQSDGTTPITGQSVWIELIQGDPCDNPATINTAYIDTGDGTYSFTKIAPGEYCLRASPSSDYLEAWWALPDSVLACQSAQSFSVGLSENIGGKDFQLNPGATISGTIYESNGTTPITGVDLWVEVYQGNPCGGYQYITTAWVDNNTGTYAITNLFPGTYYLYANTDGNYLAEWWASPQSALDCHGAQAVTVGLNDALANKNFQLDVGATISGTVYESDGETPITGKAVIVKAYQSDYCGNYQYVAQFPVNTNDGTYTVAGLAPGTYILQTGTNENYLDEWWAQPASVLEVENAQLISVGLSQTVAGKNFQLDPGGIISGTIFQGDGTTPLTGAGIIIIVYSDPCNQTWVTSLPYNSFNGTYAISRLAPGTYYLYTNVHAGNYVKEWWASPASMGDCSNAQGIAVSTGQTVTNRNFQLEVGATISGTLYESNGTTPLVDKNMRMYLVKGTPCNNPTKIQGEWIDSDNGTYSFEGIAPGTYYLISDNDYENYMNEWWASPSSVMECTGAQSFSTGFGDNIANKDFQLNAGGTISGTIYQSDGVTPITDKNIWVEVTDLSGDSWITGALMDDSNGTYRVERLSPGSYYLQTYTNENYYDEWWAQAASVMDRANAQTISVGLSENITGKNFQLDPGGTISGTVFASDGVTPIRDKEIWIDVLQGRCDEFSWLPVSYINTNNGTYTITKLLPGNYFLRTGTDENYMDEWWAQPASVVDCTSAQAIPVGFSEQIVGKNFQLNSGATISGTVYESDGVTPIRCEQIPIDIIQGHPCGIFTQVDTVWTNPDDGTYSLAGLPNGTYYLHTDNAGSFNGANYGDEWWASSASVVNCANAQGITVVSGEIFAGKDFQLNPGATISGTLFQSDGTTPLTGVDVTIQAFSGDPCTSPPVANTWYNDTDGSYTIKGLPPGTFYLYANVFFGNYINEWWASPASVLPCANAQSITVGAGDTVTGKNFQLDAGASISGTLFQSDGTTPVANEEFWVETTSGNPCEGNFFKFTQINDDGTYRVEGLSAGTYYLFAGDFEEIYFDEWWATPLSVRICGAAQGIVVNDKQSVTGKNFQLDTDVIPGDVNNDQLVDLADVILIGQIIAGIVPEAEVNLAADVNGDGKINMVEMIYVLERVTGIR